MAFLISLILSACTAPSQIIRTTPLTGLGFPQNKSCEGVPRLQNSLNAGLILSSNTKAVIEHFKAYQKNIGTALVFNRDFYTRATDPNAIVLDVSAVLKARFSKLSLATDYEGAKTNNMEPIVVLDIFHAGHEAFGFDYDASWEGTLTFFDRSGNCLGSVTSENKKRCPPGEPYWPCLAESRSRMLAGLAEKLR